MEFIYNDLPKIKIPSDIIHPTSRILFRFWESSRGEMAAAVKQNMDLKKVAPVLPNLCILERDLNKQSYKWRLAGTGICRLWGAELTGSDVLANWPDYERQTMASGFDMVVITLQPFVARFKAVTDLGSEIGIEFIAFPIQDRESGAIQILGAVVPFRSTEWIGTQKLVGFEISTTRKIWTDATTSQEFSSSPNTAFLTRDKTPPFLKIIDGGKN